MKKHCLRLRSVLHSKTFTNSSSPKVKYNSQQFFRTSIQKKSLTNRTGDIQTYNTFNTSPTYFLTIPRQHTDVGVKLLTGAKLFFVVSRLLREVLEQVQWVLHPARLARVGGPHHELQVLQLQYQYERQED